MSNSAGLVGRYWNRATVETLNQPQLNWSSVLVKVRHENDFVHPHHHHQQKLNVSNISVVTDPILNVGSWEHLEQIPTVMPTPAHTTLVMVISQLSPTRPRRNSTGSIPEKSRTDPPIKLTCVQATFDLVTSVHIRNISAVTDQTLMKL